MSHNLDELLFQDEIFPLETPAPTPKNTTPTDVWKVLIVDDEKDVHNVTKLAFREFEFEGRPVQFFSAYSRKEAQELVAKVPDFALILLDVVMEEDDAGLRFVEHLRNKIDNKLTRIIIRTGQPGQAPEKKIILEYDINDYKEKTELTQDKFYSSLVMALRSYRDLVKIEKNRREIETLLIAADRFVPHNFLNFLNKKNITEIQLGNYVQLEMTVLFLDIRSFTLVSERQREVDNFIFINSLLAHIEPIIVKEGGFIDKYMGDAIMALFFGPTDAVISAAVKVMRSLESFNKTRAEQNQSLINLGISVNTGDVVLGTVGYHDRMECTVISNAVNTAAKLEKMNKELGTRLLLTKAAFDKLKNKEQFCYRSLGEIYITGKDQKVHVIEVLSADQEENQHKKSKTLPLFNDAIALYGESKFSEARRYFQQVLELHPGDKVAAYFLHKCESSCS